MTRKLMEVTNPPGRVVVVLEVRDITNINCLAVSYFVLSLAQSSDGGRECMRCAGYVPGCELNGPPLIVSGRL